MKKPFQARGSIMIWTLLMGITLAVIFFFFSQRLNLGVASQRKTMEYLNAQLLAESYATYLENLDSAQLVALRGPIVFNGLTGTLTNATDEITGVLDMGEEAEFEVSGGDAKIEWNLCAENEEGVLEISPAGVDDLDNCGPGVLYDDLNQNPGPTITLKSLSEPTSYRLTPLADAELYDEEWRLTLEYPLSFRKKITISRTFTP